MMIANWLNRVLVLAGLVCLMSPAAIAQEILTALPGFLVPRQITEIVIRGEATNFTAGSDAQNLPFTSVSMGNSITILDVIVVNNTSLRVTIRVEQNAAAGFRDVSVTTVAGLINEQVVLIDGIEILDDNQPLMVIVNPVPVKSLLASDFDPNNLAGSPIIFTVHIFHDDSNAPEIPGGSDSSETFPHFR